MRRLVAAALAALIGMVGAGSAAQAAAMIDFQITPLAGFQSYTGASLDQSTSYSIAGSSLLVTAKGAGDASGLTVFASPGTDTINASPVTITYGTGSAPKSISAFVESWTTPGGDSFTETLNHLDSISRGTPDALTFTLSGTISDTGGLFSDSPIFMIFSANQVGGPGAPLSTGFTNFTPAVASGAPEPATWAMMIAGMGVMGAMLRRRRVTATAGA